MVVEILHRVVIPALLSVSTAGGPDPDRRSTARDLCARAPPRPLDPRAPAPWSAPTPPPAVPLGRRRRRPAAGARAPARAPGAARPRAQPRTGRADDHPV